MVKRSKLYKAACNLTSIKRFANLKLDKEYSAGEHSFRVGILSMMIADDYNKRNPKNKVNVEEVLRKALIHDLEESVIGDIPTPAKKRHKAFNDAYKVLAEDIMENDILVDSPLPELYLSLWINDKTGLSGEVIKIADGLEALKTSFYELKRGNTCLYKVHTRLASALNSPEMKELREKFPLANEMYHQHIFSEEQHLKLRELLDPTAPVLLKK